jgi:type IV pilus assembly protein PilB
MSAGGFLGDLLVKRGVIDAAGLTRAIAAQSKGGTTLGRALADLGLADESVVASTVATALHLEFLSGELPNVGPAAAALLTAEFCKKHRVVPLALDGAVLRVALSNPLDDSIVRDVGFRTGRKTIGIVVTEAWLERLHTKVYAPAVAHTATPYDMLANVDPAGQVEATSEREYELDPAAVAKDTNLPPVVRLVNLLLSDAASAGASDVHIEPQETLLQVRQRVDGLLHEVLTIPRHLQDATISRLKIMSGMDISERRKPQDGRCQLKLGGSRIDLRVSSMPTQFGEKIVIRLLNPDRAVLPIDDLGLAPENLRLLQSFLARPQGMVLVTGPTGSGKSSTLYTSLNSIKSSTNNIITLEDPIEVQVPGVNQMQVNARAGVTFASGLRSILRQDPNVILVGEIRDQETADIALGAAQTGHLLLSTLHTNDATATITRLFDLGIQPFLIAASLVGIVAQRLVRRPCPACQKPHQPSADLIERAGGASQMPAGARWVAGVGCDQCAQSGMKGRIAIHEVMAVNDEVRELISNRAAEHVIRKAAIGGGMRTLLEDGVDKAARGLTTLEEVLRVVSSGDASGRVAVKPAVVIAPTPAPAVVTATATGGKVLVVEDSPTIMQVIKYFLEIEGFQVFSAENGLLGLEMALRERPDVIVSDVMMPGMGGIEMVKALRADPLMKNVRILMLTSESTVEAEAEGLSAGADDYILKPVEPRRLAARVKALQARVRTA